MDHEFLLNAIVFVSIFLGGTAFLQYLSKKFVFPYTVALLIAGFAAQFIVTFVNLPVPTELQPDFIFYVLLPLLLFEGALHINIHELRLQFKTMTFLATFGLVISIAVIGYALNIFAGIPLGVALLFGAIISATDPIAVLALFKSLGAPKRLALIADGESMLNDATAVIAYRIIATFVIGNQAVGVKKVFGGIEDFLYVFIGSIIVGAVIGYSASLIFSYIRKEHLTLTTLSAVIAVGSFLLAEHLHLSGVITTVSAAVLLGNLIRTSLPNEVMTILEEYWGYIGFLALSPVFFFASFTLDLNILGNEMLLLLLVVAIVLLARAISVYITCFITNKTFFFKDEPNIPLSWQHILNWGGIRGVIPLVLVYSLPTDFAYKDQILRFTMATLFFTLFVNGLTIRWLLTKLKLHLPRKEEEIIKKQMRLFGLEESRNKLKELSRREFSPSVITAVEKQINEYEKQYKKDLEETITPEEFLSSLEFQSIEIERTIMRKLFEEGRFSDSVYNEFDASLDLQQDELEHKEMFGGRRLLHEREYYLKRSFRRKLLAFRKIAAQYKFLGKLLGVTERRILRDRYALLKARLLTSYAVCDYLERVDKIITDKKLETAITVVQDQQEAYIDRNTKQIKELEKEYPEITERYQMKSIQKIVFAKE